ncbi:MAPEG family protein [Methylibium sp.]|uniref:MAPEG family protein n=1 Tax=Methylibium sp. TaxID=2067992 RepID=UPI001847A159|nr:MAPEG family protein [Methylibium sp.]MBA3590131.1 MAPEG family protein [Methylibium sp.]
MTPELEYLVFTTVFTALMWVPYTVNLILVRGLKDAVGYPENPKPIYAWAQRMKAAHYNAVENLVVFAALVLVADAVDVHNAATVMACVVFFWARVVHFLAYSFKVPWARTLAFAVGFVSQLALAFQVLT